MAGGGGGGVSWRMLAVVVYGGCSCVGGLRRWLCMVAGWRRLWCMVVVAVDGDSGDVWRLWWRLEAKVVYVGGLRR